MPGRIVAKKMPPIGVYWIVLAVVAIVAAVVKWMA
jgi:hypothetical protein